MAGKYVTVVPAYGRDYKSQKAVKADFEAGKDFRVQDIGAGPDNGRAVNKDDAVRLGFKLSIRYDRLTKVVILP